MASTVQFNDEVVQNFPFKPPTMKYIFDNNKNWLKLYQCCKLFPNKFPLTVIHEIQDFTPIGQYFFYNNQAVSLVNASKIWLSDKINLRRHNLREWISDIWICTIKCLNVNRDLTLNEFKMLTQSEKIEKLQIVKIIKENGMSCFVEEIIAYVPNASQIYLYNALINPDTFVKLAAMKRKCEISLFDLYNVKVEVKFDEMLKFIEAHAAVNSSLFGIYFDQSVPPEYIKKFNAYMKCKIRLQPGFKKFNEKPCFFSTFFRL